MDVLRLTLRQLQIFVAVAGCGSTTAASTRISLSQSATSAAVNELERLLGLRLFDRHGKRLLLNDNGRALLPRALALLDGAAGVERSARDGMAQAQSLRIGASTTIGNYVLAGFLKRFLAGAGPSQAASWRSAVMVGNTAAVARAVADFQIDVGLIEGPCHEPALEVTPWVRDELLLVASPNHEAVVASRKSSGRAAAPGPAVREAVWLLREPGSGTREETDRALLPLLRSYRRSIEFGSSEAIRSAAIEGLGIACLSRWVVEEAIKSGRLVRLRAATPRMFRQCHLVLHRAKQATPALEAFVRHVLPAHAVRGSHARPAMEG